jgi:broad specificity phosphatase PhoE
MALGALVVAMLVATATLAQEPAAATKPAPMRVLLIRHASSWKNVPSAQRPHPMSAAELDSLTPQGRARAEAIGRLLVGKGVVAVHASPAQRAQQTAAAIAAALGLGEPITNQAFRPLDTGSNATAARGTGAKHERGRIRNLVARNEPGTQRTAAPEVFARREL